MQMSCLTNIHMHRNNKMDHNMDTTFIILHNNTCKCNWVMELCEYITTYTRLCNAECSSKMYKTWGINCRVPRNKYACDIIQHRICCQKYTLCETFKYTLPHYTTHNIFVVKENTFKWHLNSFTNWLSMTK